MLTATHLLHAVLVIKNSTAFKEYNYITGNNVPLNYSFAEKER